MVQTPEILWTASFCSSKQIDDVGDSIIDKILAVDDSPCKIAGSIRQRHPDSWKTDALNPGNIIRGKCSSTCRNGRSFAKTVPHTCLKLFWAYMPCFALPNRAWWWVAPVMLQLSNPASTLTQSRSRARTPDYNGVQTEPWVARVVKSILFAATR